MRSKLIGQSDEYYLLHDILRKTERITQLAPHIGWNTGPVGPQFNPFTDISWITAIQASDSPDFNTTGVAINQGSGVDGSVGEGVPTYDSVEQAFSFDEAELDVINFPLGASSNTGSYFVRFKLKNVTEGHAVIAFNSNTHDIDTAITTGNIIVSNTNTGVGMAADQWVVVRARLNATASVIEVNNTGEVTGSYASNSMGTTGTMGRNNPTTNRLDGFISHVFYKRTNFTAEEITNMKNWFIANAPWD